MATTSPLRQRFRQAGHRSDLNSATLAVFPRVSNCNLLITREMAMPAKRRLTMAAPTTITSIEP